MSAITLPASIEALTTSAAGPVSATADGGAGFPELLSSLAAGIAGSSPETRADRDPRTTGSAPGAPNHAVIEVSPLAPETPVGTQDTPELPVADDANSTSKDPSQSKLVATIAADAAIAGASAISQPPAEAGYIPLPARLVGTSRVGRQRGGENEAVEPGARHEHVAEPAPLTIQQALAAVAAIAPSSSAAPIQTATFSASQSPLQNAAGEARLPAPTLVSGGMAKSPSAQSILSLEARAVDDGPAPKGDVPVTLGSGLPLDPGILTASLGHASSAAIAPHGLATLNDPQASSPELHQLDALMRDIAEVSGTSGRASFRLTADQLGPIDVRLHTSDAGVAVTIRTHDDQSHTTVAQAQQQLTDDMRANGLKVAATNVMLGGGADRQRQDRPHAQTAFPIEVAAPEDEQSKSLNTPRPDGRYA